MQRRGSGMASVLAARRSAGTGTTDTSRKTITSQGRSTRMVSLQNRDGLWHAESISDGSASPARRQTGNDMCAQQTRG